MYKNRFLWIVILAIFTSTASVFARGQSEDPIRQARELVSENRINEAILLLEQTVRDDPERIQQAEALLRTIREIRGEYNVLFDSLIDNLVNNPDDIERTLAIIDEMEALDKFPNERVVKQIEDARVVAQLAYDRNLAEERMEEARGLLAEGEYDDAIDVYLSLRTLQRDRFEQRGYGDIFVNSVNGAISDVPVVSEEFQDQLPGYQRIAEEIEAAAEDTIDQIDEETLDSFFLEAAEIVSLLDQAQATANEIAVLRSQVPLQFPDDPIDWYLNFQEMITRGRNEFRGTEGIVYAIEAAYRRSIVPLVDASRERVVGLMERGDIAAEDDAFSEARIAYQSAIDGAVLWVQSEAAQVGFFETDPELQLIVEQRDPEDARRIITAKGYAAAAESLTELSSIMAVFVETGESRDDTLFSLRSQRDSTNGIVSSLQSGRTAWQSVTPSYNELPEVYRSEDLDQRLADTTEAWITGADRGIQRERNLVRRIAAARTEEIPDRIGELENQLQDLSALLTGVEIGDADEGEAVRIVRFPDDALVEYRRILTTATADIEEIVLTREEVEGEPEYVLEGAVVQGAQERLDRLEDDLNEIVTVSQKGIEDAQELIARSEELIEEAEARVADMRAAISAFQVEAAKNNFDALRDAYFESLELREDVAFREEVDGIIQQLGDELQELENVIVVRRVRELLIQANNLYNQDEYVAARDTLIEAQQTWEQTNVVENTEIERLLRLVTAALSLEEGRELSITDPLYPILSNYLSIAREDFNRARELYDEGRQSQAEPYFDRAIENLRNVRDVRPLNWDARILELRISQIRNEDDFESVFESRYEQALGRLDDDGPLAVYSELEVLAEINPEYPGIQDQIRRLEIALNLRPDPVDRARRQQAAGLFQRAQSLAGGTRDQINVAVSLLEQAIELDPTNGDAAFLLDQLRIQLGGQATVALTTADEQQYRRAETLFSQGQVLQALSVVERLLQDGENQNYPPLVDLRRRIALRLGI